MEIMPATSVLLLGFLGSLLSPIPKQDHAHLAVWTHKPLRVLPEQEERRMHRTVSSFLLLYILPLKDHLHHPPVHLRPLFEHQLALPFLVGFSAGCGEWVSFHALEVAASHPAIFKIIEISCLEQLELHQLLLLRIVHLQGVLLSL